jgi:hypothetical protein
MVSLKSLLFKRWHETYVLDILLKFLFIVVLIHVAATVVFFLLIAVYTIIYGPIDLRL